MLYCNTGITFGHKICRKEKKVSNGFYCKAYQPMLQYYLLEYTCTRVGTGMCVLHLYIIIK